MIGPGDAIRIPPGSAERPLRGRAGRRHRRGGPATSPPEQAAASILGYTFANDVTARDHAEAATGSGPGPRASTPSARSARGSRPTSTRPTCDLTSPEVNGELAPARPHQPADASTSPTLIVVHLAGDDAAARRRGPHRHARRASARSTPARRGRRHHRGHRHADQHRRRRRGRLDGAAPDERRPHPVLPVADRHAARRPDPHRAVQLGATPGTPAARSCSASRTPTPPATPRSPTGALLDALRWLGLDWDEGPEVGGPHGPYRQSRARATSTATSPRKLLAAGHVYESFSHHRGGRRPATCAAGRDPKLGYDNYDRDLDRRAEGRLPRRGPRAGAAAADARRGPRLERPGPRRDHASRPGTVPDFVLVRGNGEPLYTLVNPVDDALMGITHVLRGEDLLPSTPRQIALYEALIDIGVAERRAASSGTCPTSSARATRSCPSATRSPTCSIYRERGFIPEGLLNYLALLGWSIADDRDVFSPRRRWSPPSTSRGSTPTRPASTRRRPRRSTPRTSARCRSRTSPTGVRAVPGRRPGCSADAADRRAARAAARRSRRWSRSG